jgi:excisionase family DNA binding protein
MAESTAYKLLRPEEVARMLGLSKPRIYQLAESREIPSVRIGKSIRFLIDDVSHFIKSHRRVFEGQ